MIDRKNIKPFLIPALALLIVVVMLGAYVLYTYNTSDDLSDQTVSIIIKSGDSFNMIADSLIAGGVVDSPRLLKWFARYRQIDRKLVPGRYDFSGRNSVKSVLDRLEQGDFLRIRVTIYEGLPIWKIASMLSELMEIDSSRLVALNHDSAFLARRKLPYLEGYLFPETYFFPWGTTLEDMILEMTTMFSNQTSDIWTVAAPNELSRDAVLILASIVEAEARYDDEKPKIASVYHNRLKRRMKLDADPTVIYGLGGLDRPLWLRDLRQKTPYNTYRKKGLPPTPINSPGLAAIKAVLQPDETDYLFFVADGTGRHRFSRTNAEHNRARREIKAKNGN